VDAGHGGDLAADAATFDDEDWENEFVAVEMDAGQGFPEERGKAEATGADD
jgi:hypothetical protein